MLVFRDGGRRVALRPLLEQLRTSCRRLLADDSEHRDRATTLAALLRAGEMECALADAGSPAVAVVEKVTDALADALLGRAFDASALAQLEAIPPQEVPEYGRLSTPEGFAYYALHPLDYADAVADLPAPSGAVVIGIRSIGTTLSAVARAALATRGIGTQRFTVRPTGHPWDRVTEFSPEQQRCVAAKAAGGADFLIVDEGPGLSGSSFLSVAEGLLAAGVARERITLLGSHAADPARMCARDAATRWPGFRYLNVAAPSRLPQARGQDLSGGEWRARFLSSRDEWPASWTAFERRKFRSADGTRLFKFEGLGHHGETVRERSRRLADLGFSPPVADAGDGFSAYEFIAGAPMRAVDARALEGERATTALRRIAEYCAARAEHMRVPAAETAALEQLVAVNWREALGEEIAAPQLLVERPVIADARMQPHEWVRDADGTIWKTDAAGHGDDHFFPGPTDIAWDLAGTIVEWQLAPAATAAFLAEYHRLSRDDCSARLPGYLLAYTLFRLGYSEMAADAMRGSEEEMRLRCDAERYRHIARDLRAVSVAA